MVEKNKSKIPHVFANILEIPSEVLLDLPRIVLIGDTQVLIENHRGILKYISEELCINTALGVLKITGIGLVIGNISGDEITVGGRLDSVVFLR